MGKRSFNVESVLGSNGVLLASGATAKRADPKVGVHESSDNPAEPIRACSGVGPVSDRTARLDSDIDLVVATAWTTLTRRPQLHRATKHQKVVKI
jgi:hypothetical protein